MVLEVYLFRIDSAFLSHIGETTAPKSDGRANTTRTILDQYQDCGYRRAKAVVNMAFGGCASARPDRALDGAESDKRGDRHSIRKIGFCGGRRLGCSDRMS